MSVGTMSKKRRVSNEEKSLTVQEAKSVLRDLRTHEDTPKPRATSYVAPPCSACIALRPSGSNYSRVETTRGRVRYCKCGYCGNTFKDVDTTP